MSSVSLLAELEILVRRILRFLLGFERRSVLSFVVSLIASICYNMIIRVFPFIKKTYLLSFCCENSLILLTPQIIISSLASPRPKPA